MGEIIADCPPIGNAGGSALQCQREPSITKRWSRSLPRFRPAAAICSAGHLPVSAGDGLRALLDEVFAPANFYVAPALEVACFRENEEITWEIFHGRLLDPAHTREKQTFESWNLFQCTLGGRAMEPLLSLKLDQSRTRVHVVRGIESFVWEGYDAGGNVYLSREVRKWVRELVGTVDLSQFNTVGELRDELICELFYAVVGTSRLPLASVETPLPQFSFGQLFYCYRSPDSAADGHLRTYRELVDKMLTEETTLPERSRLLEVFLHAVPFEEMHAAAGHFVERFSALGQGKMSPEKGLALLLRSVFNDVSLSPYTDLVANTLCFVNALEARGVWSAATATDFLSYLIRQNVRHLTAYDLVTFHHRGANYPDALLLDEVLKDYLARCDKQPSLFLDQPVDSDPVRSIKRRRRRALRQGYLLRRRYENHAVPDQPTSPGENMRVLPVSHPRVPEEQLTQPMSRTKLLFVGNPLTSLSTPNANAVLRQSIADFGHPDELRELGMALFLDRPLGVGKAATEPDATLLTSCEAFSHSIAQERLRFLLQPLDLLTPEECDTWQRALRADTQLKGLTLDAVGGPPRPGVISLSDARRAAPDFIFLRTTAGTLRELFDQYDFSPLTKRFRLALLEQPLNLLLVRNDRGVLVLHDAAHRPRLEMEVDTSRGYRRRGGREVSVAGLRVLRVWEDASENELPALRELSAEAVVVWPRDSEPGRLPTLSAPLPEVD